MLKRFNELSCYAFLLVFSVTMLAAPFAEAALSDDDYYGPRRLVPTQHSLRNVSNTASGAFTYEVPIVTPPGRNGIEPSLQLVYNSQYRGHSSIYGYGWNVDIPYIQRSNKTGTEKLYTDHYFYSTLSGDLEDITLNDGEHGTYGAKSDSGSFLHYNYATSTNGWIVTDKSGTVYTFGTGTSTRQYDITATSSPRIYTWYLEEVRDTSDNYITYEYFHDDGRVYPSTITYTGNDTTDGIFEVAFLREARSDTYTTYEAGFEVTTSYRISEIQTKINGSWVRKYELDYTTGDNTKRSLLASVTESGRDASLNTVTVPAISFSYQSHADAWALDSGWSVPESFEDPSVFVVDINGDALPDLIDAEEYTAYAIRINNGDDGWSDESSSWTLPIPLAEYGDHPDPSVFMADVNGDGFNDIINAVASSTLREVYINDADDTGWTLDANYVVPFSLETSAGNPDHSIVLMEVNGDGLVDVVHSDSNDKKVYINDGDGTGWTEDTNWSIPITFSTGNPQYSTRFFDVNGDGLTDIVRAENGIGGFTDDVYINNGTNTWVEDTNYTVPVAFENNGAQQRQIHIMDVNGDSLLDFVDADDDTESRRIFLNEGDGTGWVEDTNYSIPVDLESETIRYLDFDGDGLTDFVSAPNTGSDALYGNGSRADRLTQVTTAAGAQITPTYSPSTAYKDGSSNLENEIPFAFDTVSSIATSDGFGGTHTTSYVYEGASYYFATSTPEYRRFAGFHAVTEADEDGNETVTYYHQGNDSATSTEEYSDDYAKIGRTYRMEEYDESDNLYRQTIYRWENYDLGNDRDFVKKARELVMTYDGDGDHKDSAAEWTYDNNNGNILAQTQYGEVNGGNDGTFTDTGSDKRITTITYATDSNGIIQNKPKQEVINNNAFSTVSETSHYYDNAAFGVVTTGNETKTVQRIDSDDYATTTNAYNGYGLVTSTTNPRNNTTSFIYDTYNLYVATTTNALSHAIVFDYDYSSGEVVTQIDANDFITETTFDGLDRPTILKKSDLSSPSTLVATDVFTYTDTLGATAMQHRAYLNASLYTDSYTYYDGLKRSIQTRSSAEDGNYMVQDTVYDRDDLIAWNSLPYFSTGTARTSAITNENLKTWFTYDALDRPKTVTNVVGTTSTTYDDWSQTVTDALANQKYTLNDAFGNLVQVKEYEGGSTYTTNYEYDANNNLTKITDAASNVRNFTYDYLGRRLAAEDLHATADGTYGSHTYTYDANGNMASHTDAKSQTINYTYDALDRVLTENYTGQVGTEVTYTYDTGANGVGRLADATKTDATTEYDYDIVGNTVTETRTIDSTAYVTAYEHDRQSNITNITYPDNSEVRNTYNVLGRLEKTEQKESGGSFADVVTDIDYGPHGNITYKDFGNDVVSYYTYDPNELYRLKNITTIDPADEEPVAARGDREGRIRDESDAVSENQGEVAIQTGPEEEVTVQDQETETENAVETTIEEQEATTTEDVISVDETEVTTATSTDEDVETEVAQQSSPVQNTEDDETQHASSTPSQKNTAEAQEVKPEAAIVEDSNDEYDAITTYVPEREEEVPEKRTTHSYAIKVGKTEKGDDIVTTRIFGSPIHYRTISGDLEPIDVRLRDNGDAYRVEKAPYSLNLPKNADRDFAEFSGGELTIGLAFSSPRTTAVTAQKKQDNKAVTLNGALGTGIDLVLRAENDYVAKDVMLKNKGVLSQLATEEGVYKLTFNINSASDVMLEADSGTLSVTGDIVETTAAVRLTNGEDAVYIYPALASDADGSAANIVTRYEKTDTGFTLTKLLPEDWLESAVYPVVTDAVVSYYPGAGDGRIAKSGSGWSTVHDATSGDWAEYTSGENRQSPIVGHYGGSTYEINRAFFPFDTSGIPDNAIISSATLNLYHGAPYYQDTSSDEAYLVAVESTQSSTSTLSTSDFDAIGSVAWSDTEVVSGDLDDTWFDLTLNATGTSAIDVQGWTKLAVILGHDLEDAEISAGNINRGSLYYSESSGTTYDPYLEITYEVNEAPSAPSALQTEAGTNPTDVTDTTPEFSAVYEDADSGDIATHYQLQVIEDGDSWATSTPLWDSGKTALTSTTTESTRSEDVSYGGVALSEDGTKYYWRIKFWDDSDIEGTWSDGTANFTMNDYVAPSMAPYASCLSAQSGTANPTGLKCGTPVFSAIFNEIGRTGEKYRIQVATSSNFQTGVMWDSGSGGTPLSTVVYNTRSTDIVYAGNPLEFATTTYYWRIKFWNDLGTEGSWSTGTTTLTTYSSEVFQDIHYTYDAVGNITNIVDSSDTNASRTTSYGYDDLYRLTAATTTEAATSTYTHTYTYDSIGNITNKSDVGTYTYNDDGYNNPHAIDNVNGTDYTYDTNGNLTSDGTRTYTWNYNDTVASVAKGGTTYTYGYDHAKQRVFANDETATTTYAGRYYETDGSDVTKYVYVGDELVAEIEGTGTTTTYYVHTDHLGGTNVLTNASNGEAQALDYYPFGATRVNDDTDSVDIQKGFTGLEYDEDSDLHYASSRYYDQDIGRFTSQDPAFLLISAPEFEERYQRTLQQHLQNPQALNSYGYALNNPVRYTDPSGEIAPLIGAIAISPEAGTIIVSAFQTAVRTLTFIKAYEVGTLSYYDQRYGVTENRDEIKSGLVQLGAGPFVRGVGALGGTVKEIAQLNTLMTALEAADIIQSAPSAVRDTYSNVQNYIQNFFNSGAGNTQTYTTPSGAVVDSAGRLISGPSNEDE